MTAANLDVAGWWRWCVVVAAAVQWPGGALLWCPALWSSNVLIGIVRPERLLQGTLGGIAQLFLLFRKASGVG